QQPCGGEAALAAEASGVAGRRTRRTSYAATVAAVGRDRAAPSAPTNEPDVGLRPTPRLVARGDPRPRSAPRRRAVRAYPGMRLARYEYKILVVSRITG